MLEEKKEMVQDKVTRKAPRERSSSYPNVSLEEAITYVEKAKKAFANAPFSRANGAKALGYSGVSGASAAKIAALVQYGLISRMGDTYKITALADRILLPKSEEDKKSAIIEAVKTPKLYAELISKFKNGSLPSMLSNILVHDHNIGEKVSRQAANDFISSIEYAGILMNGVVTDYQPNKLGEEDDDNASMGMQSRLEKLRKTSSSYPVNLPSGIVIIFPHEMSYRVLLGEFANSIKQLESVATNTQIDKESKKNQHGEHIQVDEGK